MKATAAEAARALREKYRADGRVLNVEPYGPGRLLVIVKARGHDALGVGGNRLRKFQGFDITIEAAQPSPER